MSFQASWVAAATGGTLLGSDVLASGPVCTDSRECEPGSVYVARVGEFADGHEFVPNAMDNGAVCVITERSLDLPVTQVIVPDSTAALGQLAAAHLRRLRDSGNITVLGITGSAGKTTTKDLLGQILSEFGKTVYPRLSFNNEVGCPLTILRADEETRYLVLEMGASGPGHLRYLTEIAPLDVACVLMVGSAHLGGFDGLEGVAAAKAELVSGLVPDGTAVLNHDDPAVHKMAALVHSGKIRWFSRNDAQDVHSGMTGVTFSVDGQQATVSLVGDHQVMNALAALQCAQAAGIKQSKALRALSRSISLSPHRMVVRTDVEFAGVGGLTIIDDSYNANPDSVRAGLKAASSIADGRLVVVLGEMLELGETADSLHIEMALAALSAGAQVLIGVGDGAGVFKNVTNAQARVFHRSDAAEATRLLKEVIEAGDTVFVKGSYGSGVWATADSLLGDEA